MENQGQLFIFYSTLPCTAVYKFDAAAPTAAALVTEVCYSNMKKVMSGCVCPHKLLLAQRVVTAMLWLHELLQSVSSAHDTTYLCVDLVAQHPRLVCKLHRLSIACTQSAIETCSPQVKLHGGLPLHKARLSSSS